MIVVGDMNAKIGADITGYNQAMGKHGLGQLNDNGEIFAKLLCITQLGYRMKLISTQIGT